MDVHPDADGVLPDSEQQHAQPTPSRTPAKTKRTRARAAPTPAAVAPPTRVLRTRKPKDADRIKAERELEDAYRRAIAQ